MFERLKECFSNFVGQAYKSVYPEIPIYLPMDGWKEVKIKGNDEPLVPLGPFSDYGHIYTDGVYAGERLSSPYKKEELGGALLTAFVRKGIAERLNEASKHLPEKHAFLVLDAYRNIDTQQALFEDFRDKLIAEKGLSFDDAVEAAQQFVSIPSTDPSRPSPHNTGASVDLTIIKFTDIGWANLKALENDLLSSDSDVVYAAEMKRLQLMREETTVLPMGTAFDEMSPNVATRFYEDKQQQGKLPRAEEEILSNRRLLVDVMGKAGFSNYPEEWFHFDFGNQFHAKRLGIEAEYGAAEFSDENAQHELMRVNHYKGSEILRRGAVGGGKLGVLSPLQRMVRNVGLSTGPMDTSQHPKAHRLEVH